MKIIKSLILLLPMFLLSGCTINYDLTIDSKVNEVILINSDIYKKEVPMYIDDYDVTYESTGKLDGYKYYDLQKYNGNTIYKAAFNKNTFRNATSCNLLFEKCNFVSNEGITVLSTTTGTIIFETYPELEAININITLNGEVVNHNADKVSDNMYSWYINPSNAKEKRILFEYKGTISSDFSQTIEDDTESKDKENIMYLSILLIVLIGLAVLIVFMNRKKFKNN